MIFQPKEEVLLWQGVRYAGAKLAALLKGTALPTELAGFVQEWFSPAQTMQVQTSGSTGQPKILLAEKQRMRVSAQMTCSVLGLQPGDTALLCMPLRYIGAKMQVVRSLVWPLELICVPPSSQPLQDLDKAPDFAAMTPSQALTSLENPLQAELLRGIDQLILGGGPVDATLAANLKTFPRAVWSTYGMTETLSHIALRRLSGPEASDWYTPFKGISLSLSNSGTLVISAPELCASVLETHDLAELATDGRFRILGRLDNVVNSGGVKIHLEEVEAQLGKVLDFPFLATAVPDAHYGEVVALLALCQPCPLPPLLELCRRAVPPYHAPRRIFFVASLPQTGSGKADRAAARALAASLTTREEDCTTQPGGED